MTLQERHHDAQHDLTWLIGALARTLFIAGRNTSVAEDGEAAMSVLQEVASCDFDAPPANIAPALVPACRFLPEALTAALQVADEAAMALAAAMEHLRWREVDGATPGQAAMAAVMGPEGPITCAHGRMHVLLAGKGTWLELPHARRQTPDHDHAEAPLMLVLAGEAACTDRHGALRHVEPGEICQPRHGSRLEAEGAILLAALFG